MRAKWQQGLEIAATRAVAEAISGHIAADFINL
jgi:hypothetical protein